MPLTLTNPHSEVSQKRKSSFNNYTPKNSNSLKHTTNPNLLFNPLVTTPNMKSNTEINFTNNLSKELLNTNQDNSTLKKAEYVVKRIALGKDISCIPPNDYANRFVEFIDDMFDDSCKKKKI